MIARPEVCNEMPQKLVINSVATNIYKKKLYEKYPTEKNDTNLIVCFKVCNGFFVFYCFCLRQENW